MWQLGDAGTGPAPCLLSIHMAEAILHHRPSGAPRERELRLRFLRETLAPYEVDAVVQQIGLPKMNHVPSRRFDLREKQAQAATLPGRPHRLDADALPQIFAEAPEGMQGRKAARTLQCIAEVGSARILTSIRSATRSPLETPLDAEGDMGRLLHIHTFLDRDRDRSHVSVARNRYLKYCYYQSFQAAVEALSARKRCGRAERRQLTSCKQSASYRLGRRDLPPTPALDYINDRFASPDDDEKSRTAPEMVKTAVVRKITAICGSDGDKVSKNMTLYLREGKTMHLILQGEACLDPGLLLLLPTQETSEPSLDIAGLALDDGERRRLAKPIRTKE